MKKFIGLFSLLLMTAMPMGDAKASDKRGRDRFDDFNNRGCTAKMLTRRGRIIDSFVGYSCHEAKNKCERQLRRRNRTGRNLGAYCDVDLRGRRGGQVHRVTRSCSADLKGRFGRTRKTFYAQAVGRAGTGVKRIACDKAVQKCRQFKRSRGVRGQCYAGR